MSSMLSRIALATVLATTATHCYAADPQQQPGQPTNLLPAQPAMVQPLPGQQASTPSWPQVSQQLREGWDSSTDGALANWRRLQQNDRYSFSDIAGFLVSNPGWPGEDRLRRLAEGAIDPGSTPPASVVSFFSKFPPKTATGQARYAVALSALGKPREALFAAREAWRGGVIPIDDEGRLLGLFSGSFTAADHDDHTDALLFAGNVTAARRAYLYTSPRLRPVYEARIAMKSKAPDAASLMQIADPIGGGDPGYLADKANWLRDSGNSLAARSLLANRPTLTRYPANGEKWLETLLTMARASGNDAQWSSAWGIASRLDDAYPTGTVIREKPIGERDDYTSLAWLAGTTAFYQLNKPRDAMGMFQRYAEAAKSPQTVSKGYYWAGRAAEKAGDQARAADFLNRAAAFADQYYGQLALERLRRPIPRPAAEPALAVTDAERKAFASRGVVRAARLLGQQGQWRDQSLFLRAIAANAQTEKDHYFAVELAKNINRPDLGVMVGRSATSEGYSGYSEASFPKMTVPGGHQDNWTMIHAITRQESQFDRQAVSHAGARGLMQLMPGTARETAGRIGLSYTASSLTDDTGYNIQLGSTYFTRMLSYYGGSYPLAVAAYNAGPGNVNKWIAANGDPRMAGGDMLRWIENIPIYETKNYVQRVLENAVVYDVMNPDKARFTGPAPLSRYLGKNTPG